MTWHLSHRNPPLERERSSRDGSGSEKKKLRQRLWEMRVRERKVELEYYNGVCLCASSRGKRAWEEVTEEERRCKVGELQAARAGGIDSLMEALEPYTLHQTHKQMHMLVSRSCSFSHVHIFTLCTSTPFPFLSHSCDTLCADSLS